MLWTFKEQSILSAHVDILYFCMWLARKIIMLCVQFFRFLYLLKPTSTEGSAVHHRYIYIYIYIDLYLYLYQHNLHISTYICAWSEILAVPTLWSHSLSGKRVSPTACHQRSSVTHSASPQCKRSSQWQLPSTLIKSLWWFCHLFLFLHPVKLMQLF